MKPQLLRFIILLATIPSSAYAQEKTKLVGEWTDAKNGQNKMNFYADDRAEMIFIGQSSPKSITFIFRVDFSKKPHWIDLCFKKASGDSLTISGILDFLNDSTIKIYLSDPGTARPVNFNEADANRFATLTRTQNFASEPVDPNNRYIVSGKRDGKDLTDTVAIKDPYVLNELKKVQEQGKNYKPTEEKTREEFDEKGKLVKKYATSLDKSLFNLSYTKYTYNKANQQIKMEKFDGNHRLVNAEYDIAVTENTYDRNGNMIEEKYLDKDLKPAVYELGPHIIRTAYDQKNRVTEETYFDKLKKPLKDFAKIKYVYDKSGKLAELIYFDEKGKEFKREKQ